MWIDSGGPGRAMPDATGGRIPVRVTTGVTRRSRQASTARRRPSRPVAVQLQGAVRTVYTQLIVPDVQCGTVARPRLLVALCYNIIGPHVHPDSLLPSVARGAP